MILVALIVLALVIAWLASRPSTPDAFYDLTPSAAAKPGALLRNEPFSKGVPPGARAWRILYATTRADHSPAIASAVVVTSAKATDTPSPVIAWAHGTTGIARGCAPSVMAKPFALVPGFERIIEEQWTYVAADYVGLGADEGHAYLIGEEAARGVLNAIRAARQVPELALDERVIVWGHSQGGNSALWTGIVAPRYAPDVKLLGVAALAPASDLRALVGASQGSLFGKITSSYLIHAYSRAYPDVQAQSYLRAGIGWLVNDMASRCVGGWETLVSALQAAVLPGAGIFASDPMQGPLGERLKQNTPKELIAAPVLIAQGEADDLVLPGLQQHYVADRCAIGQPIDYRSYTGRDHLSLVADDSPLAGELIDWTRGRFAGQLATPNCELARN
jgi:pimeloyl-ACP methyl ester carboxylesterase